MDELGYAQVGKIVADVGIGAFKTYQQYQDAKRQEARQKVLDQQAAMENRINLGSLRGDMAQGRKQNQLGDVQNLRNYLAYKESQRSRLG